MSQILDALRGAIRKSDKSRYRLSKETGIQESQLSRLMSGTQGVSFHNLEKLAEALDLEIIIRPRRKMRRRKES